MLRLLCQAGEHTSLNVPKHICQDLRDLHRGAVGHRVKNDVQLVQVAAAAFRVKRIAGSRKDQKVPQFLTASQ